MMSSTESKKSKRRRNKRGSNKTTGNEPWSLNLVDQVKDRISETEGISEIEQLMDTEDDLPRSHFNNPYLGKEKCLLCRCQRPDIPQNNKQQGSENDLKANKENMTSVSQLRFWVCPDCKHSAEEDEKRNHLDTNYLTSELLLQAPNLQSIPPPSESNTANGNTCNCEACIERREIEAEHERITQQLQSHWMEVRQAVRTIYRESSILLENSSKPDIARLQELVHKLCSKDPHQLYQRLETQGRDYVMEVKMQLLKQLNALGQKTAQRQHKQFVSLLLDEYASLCLASRELTTFLQELESEHLKRFNLTWELVNRHLFQSIIYSDNIIQDNIWQNPSSRDSIPQDGAANLLYRYTKFTDEMTVISVMWKESQQLLESYNDTQAAMKTKQRMLKEDLEFFKTQRKILEQQVRRKTGNVQQSDYGPNFTETMRHLLAGTKPSPDDCHCSRCNQKRCPCDECGISHMITCGIIGPENNEIGLPNLSFPADQSKYSIDVSPSSMSSSDSSGPCSPPFSRKLCLPFNDCGGDPESDNSEDDQQGDSRSLDGCTKCEDDSIMNSMSAINCQENSLKADILGESLIPPPPPPSEIEELIESCECHVCTSPAQSKGHQIKSEEKPCECYVCLQHNDGSLHTSFLQQALLPPGSLYPHGPNHVKPLIHPHLYNLHTSSSKSHKHTSDLDSMDLYSHQCGEWENTYDNTKLLLSSRKYGGHIGNDMFLSNNSTPFMNGSDDPSLRVRDVSPIKTSSNVLHSPNKIAPSSVNGHIHPDTCFINIKTNGKNSTTNGQSPHHHGDFCVKHTPAMHSHSTNPASSPSHNKHPMKITPEILRMATINAAKEEARALNSAHQFHICNHTRQHMHSSNPTPKHTCQNMLDPKTGLFTVPVTTANTRVPGTGCTDPECDGHHFENEDSLDDTGSEKSSSTTNSTQRDSKHCDCCYCEVFGHGAPSVAPVSRNYPEMRERLRLRLSKKKQIECKNMEVKSNKEKQERAVDYRALDELISFINGTSNEKTVSSKAAKRARQKQRKAEERARRLEETQKKQETSRETVVCHAQEIIVNEMNLNGDISTPIMQRKNKKNKKEVNENNYNNGNTCRSNNNSYSSENGLASSPNRERKSPKSGNIGDRTTNNNLIHQNNTIHNNNNSIGNEKDKKSIDECHELNLSPKLRHNFSSEYNLVDKQLLSSGKKKKKDNKSSSPVSHQHIMTHSGCISRQELCFQKPLSPVENKPHLENYEIYQDKKISSCENKNFNCSKIQDTSDIMHFHNNSLPTKSRKNKKKKTAVEENGSIDDVFQPKDIDLDNGELDETERELEAFKRFCWNSIPPERKEKVHVNLKDIIIKKKSAISCT